MFVRGCENVYLLFLASLCFPHITESIGGTEYYNTLFSMQFKIFCVCGETQRCTLPIDIRVRKYIRYHDFNVIVYKCYLIFFLSITNANIFIL